MKSSRATSWTFIRLYGLAFLFFSANSILAVIVPLRSEAIGASNAAIGWIMGAYMLTCMFFRPLAGKIIQRHGASRVLRVLLLVNGFALLLYPLTGLLGFLAARLLQGIATAFFSMALQIAIIDSLSDEERSQGISLYSLFTYMPGIIGPVLALALWNGGDMNAFFAVMVLIAVGTGIFGFTTPIRSPGNPASGGEGQAEPGSVWHSFGQIFTIPPLALCTLLMLGTSVVFGAVTVFVPLYAAEIVCGNAGLYMMIQAAVIVAARFALRKRIPSDGIWRPRFVQGVVGLAGIAVLLLAAAESAGPAAFYAAAALMGVAQALLYPSLTTYLTFALPQASRNMLLGLFIASADLGISLGGLAMGPVADRLSYSGMYGACAVLLLLLLGAEKGYRSRVR
ncbi:staphylopine family metallophore export MFS transporter CntE [Saccharibacillus brassicae]|uniref:MFS transporter n=1 Tax=Saccharibacillus brassicae TaxID=2583377 RepID=A0A4Y6UQB2_SACBS|nr:MFS transporter [Saccharibacillus brassicae]QDH19829.1 MFS transporter [Saccharibacillus brassicae]